jgi:hypothetical protein
MADPSIHPTIHPIIRPIRAQSRGRRSAKHGYRTRIVQVLLVCLLVAGCTASFTYNHLDWLIPWYVESYVDLTRDQKRSLREQLEPVLAWHREKELVRYMEILDNMNAALDAPLTGAQVNGWIQDIVTAVERTEFSMVRLGLEFGDQLSDAQMQEFVDSLWQRQRDFEEEFLERSDAEYVEDNADELADFLDDLLGRLSDAQKQRLQSAAQSLCRFDRPWLADSEDWLRELEPLLERRTGWQADVEAAFRARKSHRSPEFRTCLDRNYAVISEAVADVCNEANERQRDHLRREMADLRSRIQKLIETSD